MPVPTPYLRVDLERLRRNVRRVADDARVAGIDLRPHVKTHKSLAIARLQLASGAVGVTVATVAEAEVFVRGGCTDVLIAYPLWVDDDRAGRLRDLAGAARIAFGIDSVAGAAQAGRLLGGLGIEVLVEVDSGHHRTGAVPERAGEVARTAMRAGLPVRGAFTYPGHAYAPGGGASAAADERAALLAAASSMTAVGVPPRVLSGGSTPSLDASLTANLGTNLGMGRGEGRGEGPDERVAPTARWELRPGVYVFGDAQQWELGSCDPADLALTCRATVVSHAHGRMVLDAGSKVLGADRPGYASGFGRLLEDPDARVVQLSEHHAVVETPRTLPPLGTRVEVVPNHVCAAVNLADRLWVEEGGGLREWPVDARGLNH